jgi:hypothetical protein
MRTLFLVHLEESFHASGLISDELIAKIKYQISIADKIISFESTVDLGHYLIDELLEHASAKAKYVHRVAWGWDYEPEYVQTIQFVIPVNTPHKFTWIPKELRNARQWDYGKIMVAGGARGECLDDFLAILNYVNLKYECRENLTYGSKVYA